MRAHASSLSASVAAIGLPGAGARVLSVVTPSALASAGAAGLAGGAPAGFGFGSPRGAADSPRGGDMHRMRSALSDAKRRLAVQKERMREQCLFSP